LGTSCNPGAAANPCSQVTHANNGQYCGTTRQANFDKNNAYIVDPNTVYECFDGQIANETHCAAGCFVAAAGQPDACNSSDPCARVPSSGDGLYCGRTSQSTFNPLGTADPDAVYHCIGGHTTEYAFCPPNGNGCNIAPPGQPDACNNDPCAQVPA